MKDGKAIITKGLTKHYGAITAVDGLDMEINEGEICGILGPNGAGKTTTILMLLGLTEPTAGHAAVLGFDPVRDPLQVKRHVGYLPERVGFYENMTGRENLLYVASLNNIGRKEASCRIDELASQVDMQKAIDRKVGEYSHGMKQRLGLASCLVKSPRAVILDEPTSGIDPTGTREVLDFISMLSREKGITVLLSSHLLYQVQQICDRVVIFVGGKAVAMGPIESLGRQMLSGNTLTIEVECDGSRELLMRQLQTLEGVEKVENSHGRLLVSSRCDLRQPIVSLVQGLNLTLLHLRLRGYDLDDIYQQYFQGVQRV